MSRDIYDPYERAIAAATDCGFAPGRVLNDIVDGFELKDDAFGLFARDVLFRKIGLIKAEITIGGPWFDVDCLYQRSPSQRAWIMPIYQVPAFGAREGELIDLVAFADDGPHAGRTWRLIGACDAIGLPFESTQRVLTVFTQPKLWLAHWLKACTDNFKWLDAAETGPESFSALVLDAKKITWKSHRLEPLATAQFDEIRFADSPALRDAVFNEMKLDPPRLPRLRAIKAKPEGSHGPPSTAA